MTVASVMLCATPLSLVLSSGSECCNAKSNIPDQNWLNVLDVTHGHSKKWLCYTKGKPCCGDYWLLLPGFSPFSICLMLLFLISFKNDLHRELFPTRWLWQSTTFWSGGEVWTMIFTQFYLNHDESAGIVRCGVHMLFMFSCLLHSCPQHWAFGCPPQMNISLLSVRNRLSGLLWWHNHTHNY